MSVANSNTMRESSKIRNLKQDYSKNHDSAAVIHAKTKDNLNLVSRDHFETIRL